MAPPTQTFGYVFQTPNPTPPPVNSSEACTATWNGATSTLTDTVTSGGAVQASFAGQAYAFLNTPLQGWASGNSS
jgi:hypothetical protein